MDSYMLEDKHIPSYIKVECKNKETLHILLSKLGIDEEKAKPWTFYEMMKYITTKE